MSSVSRIGIICEDITDYTALKIIIKKIIRNDHIGFKPKSGSGCSKIRNRNKCIAWARDLSNRKCDMLIVVHDLDRRKYKELHKILTTNFEGATISNYFISIPIEELEAWLIADPEGIRNALSLKRPPNFSGQPESISSPKEKLENEIYACSSKEIEYQTSMNARIAEHVNINKIIDKCPSFKLFYDHMTRQSYRI